MKFALLIVLYVGAVACDTSEHSEQVESSINTLSKDCKVQSLMPHLYAEMCLPEGSKMKDSDDYNSQSNSDYKFVKFDITLPSKEVIYVRELAKEKGVEDILDYRRENIESEFLEAEIIESTTDHFIEKTKGGEYVIHYFKSTYGWPYYLKTSNIKDLNDVKVIVGYLKTLNFVTR